MLRLVCLCFLLGLVTVQGQYNCNDNSDIAAFASDIEDLTADMMEYEDVMNTKTDRVAKVVEVVRDLKTRVDDLAGSGCDDRWEFQCGGTSPMCVSRLLVCDTVQDCPNAAEESQCRIFTPTASEWHAEMVWDHCTSRRPKEFHLTINEYKNIDYLMSFPEIKGTMEIEQHTDDFYYAATLRLHGWMDLKPGNHILFFEPADSDGLALTCTFDGVEDNHCHGTIVHQASMTTCAEFAMRRM